MAPESDIVWNHWLAYRENTYLRKRNGQAREVALAAVYLASHASSFTTVSIIDVGGGRYLR